MKSTSTYPFFESLGLYWIPYSLSSIAHRAILPDKSGLCIVLRRGGRGGGGGGGGGGGQLIRQWGAHGSKGEVFWSLSGGLRRPTQDGYTWFLHRLRIC